MAGGLPLNTTQHNPFVSSEPADFDAHTPNGSLQCSSLKLLLALQAVAECVSVAVTYANCVDSSQPPSPGSPPAPDSTPLSGMLHTVEDALQLPQHTQQGEAQHTAGGPSAARQRPSPALFALLLRGAKGSVLGVTVLTMKAEGTAHLLLQCATTNYSPNCSPNAAHAGKPPHGGNRPEAAAQLLLVLAEWVLRGAGVQHLALAAAPCAHNVQPAQSDGSKVSGFLHEHLFVQGAMLTQSLHLYCSYSSQPRHSVPNFFAGKGVEVMTTDT